MSNSPAPPPPSERAQDEALFTENQRIVGDIVKKYFRQYLFDDDVMQEARLAFWRACCALTRCAAASTLWPCGISSTRYAVCI